MSILKKLSLDELFYILDCKKLKYIPQSFDTVSTKELIQLARELNPITLKRKGFLQALTSTFTDSSVYPFLLLWNLTGLITLNPLILGIVTSLFFIFLINAARVHFSGTFYELSKEERKTNHALQMIALKQAVADEILSQLKPSFMISALSAQELKQIENKIELAPQKRDALTVGMVVGTTMFSTYFVGLNAIFTALGLTTVAVFMSTPIGLLIGGIISAAASLFLGRNQYNDDKQNEIARKKQNKLTKHFNVKIEECYRLQKICKKNQLINDVQNIQPIKTITHEHNNLAATHGNYKLYKNPMVFVNRKKQKHKHHSEIYTSNFSMSY